MKDNFDRCLSEIFKHEGGYVDHPRDPGGATNMGITIATLRQWRAKPVSKADVKNLTRAEAAAIYRAWYWQPVRGDDLPAGLDLVAFDAAVNSGVSRGAKWLQSALGVAADGQVGPKTIAAAQTADAATAARRALQARMSFLRGLSTWGTFGKGWTRRLESVEREALAMIAQPAKPTAPKPVEPAKEPAKSNPLAALIAAIAAIVVAWASGAIQAILERLPL